jgi:uncharacterized repeat protein (TIGR01451 family)
VTTVGLGIVNTFIAGNQAAGIGNGAALHIAQHERAALSYVTIADDIINGKQAIYYDTANASHRLLIANTIIASHTTGIVNTGNPLNAVVANTLFFKNGTDGANFLNGGGIINSVANQDPRFVNPALNDYHIGSGSAAINKGIDDTLTKDDIDGDFRPLGGGFDLGADEAAAKLTITKTGPVTVATGSPITYTLTITNTGPATATNLVITDRIPTGAVYQSGGTLVGQVVSFTLNNLGPNGAKHQAAFRVTAATTVTNSAYRVSADGNISATGQVAVTTIVGAGAKTTIYLPLVLKN